MAIWRKPLQFINVMLANRSPIERGRAGSGENDLCQKKEHDLRVSLECAGN